MVEQKTKQSTSWFLSEDDGQCKSLLLLSEHRQALSAAVCGCAARAVMTRVPILLAGSYSTIAPAVKFAEATSYCMRFCAADTPADVLLAPGDSEHPVAAVLAVGPGGFQIADAADILGNVMTYLTHIQNTQQRLAIVIEDLPVYRAIRNIEAVLELSRQGNIRFLLGAQNTSEIAVAYPATAVKVIENCQRLYLGYEPATH